MRTLPFALAFFSLLAAAALPACTKTGAAAESSAATKPSGPPPVPVTLAHARSLDLQRTVRIVGSLVGLETATLSNRVTGTVSKIYVDRSDRVKPGAKLLEIEPDRFQMAVHESEAALEQTLARLGLKEVPGEDFDINQTAPVKKAKSEYDNAKGKYDRATPLNQSKALNDFEYMDIASALKSAESALENSRDEARALLAQARQNRTTVQMRSKDSSDSIIVAPDGTTPDGIKIDSYAITDRKISTGEYLREGTPLFTLVADTMLKLEASVPERFLGDVKLGAAVTFKVEAYPNEIFTGKVYKIDPAIEIATRSFLVDALVDNAHYNNRLRPGSFVPGEVLTKVDPGRVMVPLEAITSYVGVTKLYKLDPAAPQDAPKVKAVAINTSQQITIQENGTDAQWVEVTPVNKDDTLTASDQVVVSGLTKLVDGNPITLKPPPTAPATQTAPPLP